MDVIGVIEAKKRADAMMKKFLVSLGIVVLFVGAMGVFFTSLENDLKAKALERQEASVRW